MGKWRRPISERIESMSFPEPMSGCWIWMGAHDDRGYAFLQVDGKTRRVSRLSYEAFKGPVTSGLMLRHTCDNPFCVNPDHLLTGSSRDNMRDKVTRGRQVRGSRTWSAKLSEDDIIAIRNDIATNVAIAEKYSISSSHVSRIRSMKKWKHVNGA